MVGRIVDKIVLSIVALVLMLPVFDQHSTMMVLAVLFTIMAILLPDILFRDAVAGGICLLAAGLMAVSPAFSLLTIPCVYGLFAAPGMSEVEKRIYIWFRNRVKVDGVANRVIPKENNLSALELFRLALVCLLTVCLLLVSGMTAGSVPVSVGMVSVVMAVKGSLAQKLKQSYYEKYDQARTDRIVAEETKKRIEKQSEDQAYMAMLQERNRIAREIHDNVGHMLTRAIVQMQAIKIINKDEGIKDHLESVDETINTAMLNIRRSVHELHDESIDLSIMLNEIVKTLPERFIVDCRTSIESAADTELKNTILGIVREAVTNIAKYSQGDKVRVEIIEHAAFWRVLVFDNGRNEKKDYSRQLSQRESGSGMGLLDIGKRAERMRGTVNITSDEKGFTVLVILPKGEK